MTENESTQEYMIERLIAFIKLTTTIAGHYDSKEACELIIRNNEIILDEIKVMQNKLKPMR